MTAARPNACHGPSVSAGAGGLDPATGWRASPDFDPGIADAAGLKDACAQPDPATHSASLAGILPTADAMTPATQNACHGPSVRIGQDTGQANQQTNVQPAALALDPERLQSGDRARYYTIPGKALFCWGCA